MADDDEYEVVDDDQNKQKQPERPIDTSIKNQWEDIKNLNADNDRKHR
jgi:hypothetical protein